MLLRLFERSAHVSKSFIDKASKGKSNKTKAKAKQKPNKESRR